MIDVNEWYAAPWTNPIVATEELVITYDGIIYANDHTEHFPILRHHAVFQRPWVAALRGDELWTLDAERQLNRYIIAENTTARCDNGSYVKDPGMGICELCGRGYYNSNPVATSCKLCTPGTYAYAEQS